MINNKKAEINQPLLVKTSHSNRWADVPKAECKPEPKHKQQTTIQKLRELI
ncbi:hypothetical protein HW132_19685 [Brasilonema sp. CT11]|nr:hypothetical protein [Brasilonema sp. CT11]